MGPVSRHDCCVVFLPPRDHLPEAWLRAETHPPGQGRMDPQLHIAASICAYVCIYLGGNFYVQSFSENINNSHRVCWILDRHAHTIIILLDANSIETE